MDSKYNHNEIEESIYNLWEDGGYFKPQGKGKPFSIIMPPPNANEALHVGHAVFVTIEDALIRYNRMNGKRALWLPGFDHAGFETQTVFEKKLEKQGQSRFQFDRDTLYKMIWDYVQENKDVAKNQLKRLGASCDWSRQKFTLDPEIVEIVYETFKKLHKDKLVYRGQRIVNWCPKHQTSLSELETKNEERKGKLWYLKYEIKNPIIPKTSPGPPTPEREILPKYITVATTRPETMLGDMAVAVHPDDKRYQNIIGQKVLLPLTGRQIPIIADKEIDINFGTGAVKVTPAHDPLDFEIAQRHNLEALEIIGADDKITKAAPQKYQGLKTTQAREAVLADLQKEGLIEKEEDYQHTVKTCYKCGRVIEPRIMDQWFVKIKPLADKATRAVKKGEVRFVSKKYEKIFSHWMKNIHDWNISRQIVWGIRIPVWYCASDKTELNSAKTGNPCYVVSDKRPKKCPKCGATKFIPETDTFDTWFSSGQWPFATLQTGEKNDFKDFYPTSVMETGWDILFFWVARMIMFGLYRTGKVPFKDVYLHGLVRDKDKQKMSKSKGNVINPLAVVDQHGADALRMALVFGSANDSDIVLGEDKIIAQRKFVTKIWNASRFVLAQLGDDFNPKKIKPTHSAKDKWILKELKKVSKNVSQNIENYKFHEAAQSIYHFFWHAFCDKCIENTKSRINEPKNPSDKAAAQLILYTVLLNSLKLLHPFMPFITEEIYQKLPHKPKDALIIENWPR